MTQQEPLTYTSNGARIIEYEIGKFKIVKDPEFLRAPRPNAEEDGQFRAIDNLVNRFFEHLDSRHGFQEKYDTHDPSIPYSFKGIFDEPITNAEQHGNEYDIKKTTWIGYSFVEDDAQRQAVFTMTVRDEGGGFNYDHVKASEEASRGTSLTYDNFRRDEPKRGRSGLGLFGLLQYCDEVSWNAAGNEITATKTLTRTDK